MELKTQIKKLCLLLNKIQKKNTQFIFLKDKVNSSKLKLSFSNNILKKDGQLFLGVPVGLDTLVWNAHRIYGEKRLPMLLNGFEILEWFGGNPLNIYNIPQFGGKFSPQPIMVCNKK